jgi:ADP-ribosylglycohydrolase
MLFAVGNQRMQMFPHPSLESCVLAASLHGSLLGTALGDALGLPYENLRSIRARRRLGPPDRMRLIRGRGLFSDDTEHALFTAAALAASAGEPNAFGRELARQFRYWMLAGPPGIGLATLKAGTRSCLGAPPEKSGVHSAGNGPAMRAPVLGAAAPDVETLRAWVHISTRLTHTDPRAEAGALAVALATFCERRQRTPDGFLNLLRQEMAAFPDAGAELIQLAEAAQAASHQSSTAFAASIGLGDGVSGYMLHTVPVVLHGWMRFRLEDEDFRRGLMEIIEAGGDTDTTAAILGGVLGVGFCEDDFPAEWVQALADWPRSLSFLGKTAEAAGCALETGNARKAPSVPLLFAWMRNMAFTVIVLGHALRRLVPL